jgi:hypothetical protein
MVELLVRLLRAPQERAARVREVIHGRWRRELRRARCRFFMLVVAFVVFAVLIIVFALHWMRS